MTVASSPAASFTALPGSATALPPTSAARRPVRLDLLHRARARRLVRAPAQKFRSVSESSAREVIEADFAHEVGAQRLPLRRAPAAPAARAAGRAAREARGLDPRLDDRL